MTNSSFDAQIAALNEDLTRLQGEREELCQRFLRATEQFLAQWFGTEAEKAVTSKPEVTNTGGIEKLREMKMELQKLIEKIPELVKDINGESYWPHRSDLGSDPPRKFDRYEYGGKRAGGEGTLDAAVREAIGHVGALLLKYGYIDFRTDTEGQWELEERSGNPRLRHAYGWSEEMSGIILEYGSKYEQLAKLDRELKMLQRRKAEAEAKELWDRA